MTEIDLLLQEKLRIRKEKNYFRSLRPKLDLIDFSSNDYLGFAHSNALDEAFDAIVRRHKTSSIAGSTGSRLLSGNTAYCEELEQKIADFHVADAGLIFNSGYNANIGLLGSLGLKGDCIIYDELIHASMLDGIHLSRASGVPFRHNDLGSLKEKLETATGRKIVAVESLYSMDGDDVPLRQIVALAKQYNAFVIVDEAHGTGVFGTSGEGLCNALGIEKQVDARVVTFGKSLGVHGAIVLGSRSLRDYLINYARSFIFTTALPQANLMTIEAAYDVLMQSTAPAVLRARILLFKKQLQPQVAQKIISTITPNQALIIPDNVQARRASQFLEERGMDVRAILFPSVPKGAERLRICLHAHNTEAQIRLLSSSLNLFFALSE